MIPRAFSCSLILVLASLPGFAQTSSSAATASGTAAVAAASVPAIPKDPNKLMLLAAQVNGLSSMGTHPWHVKANFQTFDADGKPKDQGVIEEWWAGPRKYKISHTSSDFNQVLYVDGSKVLITGDARSAPGDEWMAQHLLLQPMPDIGSIENQKYISSNSRVGSVRLKCLRLNESVSSVFCIDMVVPAIRVEADYLGFTTYFNDVVQANGHYFARQIRVQHDKKPYLNEDMATLEFPRMIDDALLAAPASAIPLPHTIRVGAGVIAGNRTGGASPKYPAMAKDARIQGSVVLRATIDKQGKIEDLRVVSGPPMLQRAALDAVYTWRYKPFTLKGEPVEVETQITVVFTLGH